MGMLATPVPLGIMLGLFIGKQTGVLLFSWIAVRLKLAALPEGSNWTQLYGIALMTGIGFTIVFSSIPWPLWMTASMNMPTNWPYCSVHCCRALSGIWCCAVPTAITIQNATPGNLTVSY
jgi:Na+/H+ antiporter NhaA